MLKTEIMSNFKSECRKFQPNIFNKIKCSNCFRQREEHSAEALESNRATRKVSKCGYLFVAPDWDFSIPLYRTKRWQRRWFVLYDDGELTYSVDDHPATIPQGVIDMNRVLEVSEAEDVTGNQFALAITSPDRATFVKGTCREESRWWHDVLSVFPRSQKQHGRHKRNATFPGIKSSSSVLQQSRSSLARTPSPGLSSFDSSGQRLRFHSCTTDSLSVGRPASAPTLETQEDVFPTKESFPPKASPSPPLPPASSTPPSPPTPIYHSTPHSSLPPSTCLNTDEHKENTPPYMQDYTDHPPTSESPPTQDKVLGHRHRTRRTAKREARGLTYPRNDMSRKLIISDLEDSKRDEKLKDIADSITRIRSTPSSLLYLNKESKDKPTREKDSQFIIQSDEINNSDNIDSFSSNIRGDPDGCGLESDSVPLQSPSDTQRVDLPAEDLLYIKKGWLLKQGNSQEWNKYWFVLQGSSLRFYRDPSAEDNGILDGIIDLSMVKGLDECDVTRNYGFRINLWDDRKCIFSAVTSGIRSNWIQALRNAAHLKEPTNRPLTLGEKIEREIAREKHDSISSSELNKEELEDALSIGYISKSNVSSRSFLSSDDDFKTASESLLANISNKILNDQDNVDLADRCRSSGRFSSSTRSHSSPPSSRRATREDFPPLKKDPISCYSQSESLQSITDIGHQEFPEKDSTGKPPTGSGETLLVDLLETQVESLKAKLEQTQGDYMDLHKENADLRSRLLALDCEQSISAMASGLSTADIRSDEQLFHQVEELQKRLELQQKDISEKAKTIDKMEILKSSLAEEKNELQNKLSSEERRTKELRNNLNQQEDLIKSLTRPHQQSDEKYKSLANVASISKFDSKGQPIRELQDLDLNKKILQLTAEVDKLRENLKAEKSESYKWKDLVKELRSLLDGRNDDMDKKREEMEELRETLKSTQNELDQTADRLYRGIEENENLCLRLRELERQISHDKVRRGSSTLSISSSRERFSSRKNLPRMDSLSDLTNFDMNIIPEDLSREMLIEEYIDLRARFEKAVNEVRALKREMREAHSQHDDLELSNQKLRGEIHSNEEEYSSRLNLMSTRIQDLTTKLSTSEKQIRTMKQKMTRAESKERRRTHSLKGKESFSLSRDMEAKLNQLESQVDGLLHEGKPLLNEEIKDPNESKFSKIAKRSKSFEESTKASRLRRKSLDGQNGQDAMKAVVRITDLESKISGILGASGSSSSSSSMLNSSGVPTLGTNPLLPSASQAKSLSHPASPVSRSPMRSPSSLRKTLRSPRATPEKLVKVNRTESEVKILREKLSCNEKLLSILQTKLNECSTWADTLDCSCSCSNPPFVRLQQHLSSCQRLLQSRFQNRDQIAVNRLQPLTLRLHELLKDKMSQLSLRRHQLKASGKWTRDSQLKCFAERLSFETLLLSQIAQAHQAAQNQESYEASVRLQELIEAHRKLSFLEKQLTNPDFDMDPSTPLDFYTSLLAEKLVVEGDVISSLANLRPHKNTGSMSETCKDLQRKLLERERSLANLVTQYKEEKLYEVAIVMAKETIKGTQPPHDESVLLEELRLREAWTMAQEIINQELVNLEASQSIMRLSHLFVADAPNSSFPLTTQLNVTTSDKLHTGAEESLRQEIEESVFTLSNKYEQVLAEYRAGNTGIINSVTATIDSVLGEFASVIAQKALIDGQLAVATGDEGLHLASDPILEENRDPLESATDVVASESHLLMFLGGGDSSVESLVQSAMNQAEFSFLYNKLSGQCASEVASWLSSINKDPTFNSLIPSVQGSLKSINSSASASDRDLDLDPVTPKIPPSPKIKKRVDPNRKSRRVSDITGMLEKCRQCEELRQEMNKLRRSLDSKRPKRHAEECRKCPEYIKTIKNLEESHREATDALRTTHKAETDRLRDQVKYDPPTRDSDDELTELKRRLCLLEEGYESQISALKKQYEEALGSQSDVCEESVRQRYQLEIEHLRGLCEKGLSAMENSHRRMVMELEEKHSRELASLQSEKEQALAEETQATLAALDAMRKAHEAEVQREVAKFKEEFLRKTQSGHDVGEIHRQHEEEMAGIRKEILDLSEKYSLKCLESASLEEKLESVTKKLSEANKDLSDLESRNTHLKSHLSSQIKDDYPKDKGNKFKQHKESELVLKDEEIARLKKQLHKSQMQEMDLSELCGQLGHFLKSERQLRSSEVSAVKDKLEHLILTTAKLKGEQRERSPRWGFSFDNHKNKFSSIDSSISNREVIRSPSCPRLSGFSSFLVNGSLVEGTGPPPLSPSWASSYDPLPSPLLGMVASRKKVFETPKKTTS